MTGKTVSEDCLLYAGKKVKDIKNECPILQCDRCGFNRIEAHRRKVAIEKGKCFEKLPDGTYRFVIRR